MIETERHETREGGDGERMNDGRLTLPLYEFENISKPVNPHYPSQIYTKFFKISLLSVT